MQHLDNNIAFLLKDTLMNINGVTKYVQVKQYNDDTYITVDNEYIEPSQLIDLLKKHKHENRWMYDQVFTKHVEYLI